MFVAAGILFVQLFDQVIYEVFWHWIAADTLGVCFEICPAEIVLSVHV